MTSEAMEKINNSQSRTRVAIFGFKDSLVGQVVNMLESTTSYVVDCFIAQYGLPVIDIEKEHENRPNSKTEFVQGGIIFGKPIFDTPRYIDILRGRGIDKAFILEDTGTQRRDTFEVLHANGVEVLSFIHPSTHLAGHNDIGEGVIIFPQCYVGYKTDLGRGTIIQSNSTIEHHNVVGEFVDINPNLTTGGFTYIGDFALINISVDIINRIRVGKGARIGAGSLVLQDCEAGMLYYGRPARKIRTAESLS